ncbi:hypothetical protein BDC45DRAFT_562240 [Circinella umbellata]|nr:hypothetical protein BDC45DRAFT_562240 [Circinella umbellata]
MKLYREHYYNKKNTINSITEPYIAPTVENKINAQLVRINNLLHKYPNQPQALLQHLQAVSDDLFINLEELQPPKTFPKKGNMGKIKRKTAESVPSLLQNTKSKNENPVLVVKLLKLGWKNIKPLIQRILLNLTSFNLHTSLSSPKIKER